MTTEERISLARVLIRASLALPRDHHIHPAIDAAVEGLMATTGVVQFRPRTTEIPPPPSAA